MEQRKVGRKPLEHAKKTTRIKVMNERKKTLLKYRKDMGL